MNTHTSQDSHIQYESQRLDDILRQKLGSDSKIVVRLRVVHCVQVQTVEDNSIFCMVLNTRLLDRACFLLSNRLSRFAHFLDTDLAKGDNQFECKSLAAMVCPENKAQFIDLYFIRIAC